MARVIGAARISNAHDRPFERLLGIPGPLDEGFAQKEREVAVAVAGEPLAQASVAMFGIAHRFPLHIDTLMDKPSAIIGTFASGDKIRAPSWIASIQAM